MLPSLVIEIDFKLLGLLNRGLSFLNLLMIGNDEAILTYYTKWHIYRLGERT